MCTEKALFIYSIFYYMKQHDTCQHLDASSSSSSLSSSSFLFSRFLARHNCSAARHPIPTLAGSCSQLKKPRLVVGATVLLHMWDQQVDCTANIYSIFHCHDYVEHNHYKYTLLVQSSILKFLKHTGKWIWHIIHHSICDLAWQHWPYGTKFTNFCIALVLH